ncbi:MAG TPA: fasciclin domain-containing protein, partial [Bacteroides reticulotermitis]|nr:fasciclin domain-containing protein [Bacteroides reticulotermitis]
MKRHYLQFCGFFLLVLTIFWGSSCDDELEGTVYRTSDVKMIDEYLEDPTNNLTDFLAIIDKADYRGMLHAYGTYTLFAPTNAAVEKY